jgi:NAD(P)-dependent dehydrogenase (short-subunit alcohol dehydrogenase family)
MRLLDGQVELVTGGPRGMGRSHAVAFAREGADVVLIGRIFGRALGRLSGSKQGRSECDLAAHRK